MNVSISVNMGTSMNVITCGCEYFFFRRNVDENPFSVKMLTSMGVRNSVTVNSMKPFFYKSTSNECKNLNDDGDAHMQVEI